MLEDILNDKLDVVGGEEKARMLDTFVEEDDLCSLSSVEFGDAEHLILFGKGKRLEISELLIGNLFSKGGMGGGIGIAVVVKVVGSAIER